MTLPDSRTLVCVVTPPGRGGIGIVRLWGEAAERMLRGVFRTQSAEAFKPGCLAYGWIEDCSGPVDEVIVHTPPAGRYPFPVFDVNCHGGIAAVRKVTDIARGLGAAETTWETFLDLAAPDAICAEAGKLAVRARTELAASVLLAQYGGALSQRFRLIAEAIAQGRETEAKRDIEALLSTWPVGRAISTPSLACMAGAPNVGKSSLLNALLGEDRAIVSPKAGTTRDAIGEVADVRGLPVTMTDLAGIGLRETELHRLASKKADFYLRKADLIILVFDASRPPNDADREAACAVRGRAAIAALNKIDLPVLTTAEQVSALAGINPVCLSALTGQGIEALQNAIADAICPSRELPCGAPVVFTQRQQTLLSDCLEMLKKGDPTAAAGRLASMTRTCTDGSPGSCTPVCPCPSSRGTGKAVSGPGESGVG